MTDPSPLDRRSFLRVCAQGSLGAASALLPACTPVAAPSAAAPSDPMTQTNGARMPVLFVGHGSPMNAIEDNSWSRAFRALGAALPQPRAVLAISAHWCTDGTWVTAMARPRTIHDFGGFPQALFDVDYPAPGSPSLATRVRQLLREQRAEGDSGWGLDHGTWSVACHLWPDAAVPIVQLSIDQRLAPQQHLALGRALRPLRDEGVLVLGSGNVTHNLRDAFDRMQRGDTATPPWARAFDDAVQQALEQHDEARLAALAATPEGKRAHPHPDHWWPLLFAAGAAERDDRIQFPITGFDLGSLSMRAAMFGGS